MSRTPAARVGIVLPGRDEKYIQHRAEQARSGAAGKHADKRHKRARTREARMRRALRDQEE